MSRRKATAAFDIGRHIAGLDEEDTYYLVEAALRHLDVPDIIKLVVNELGRPGRKALMRELKDLEWEESDEAVRHRS